MVFTKREKLIIAATIAALCLLVLDIYALGPLLDHHDTVTANKARLEAKLSQAQSLRSRRQLHGDRWRHMLTGGMKRDPAEAESQLLRSLRDWSEQSGVKLASLRPERSTEKTELPEIFVHAAGTGSIDGVRRLLLRIRKAQMPVRVRMLQLGSRKEGTDDLSLHLKVSTLYLPAGAVASDEVAGGTEGVAAGIQPTPAGTGREDSPDDYRVLVECNIFLRDRGRPRRPRVVSIKPIVRNTYDSDRSLMLRGVARNGAEFVAFFEDIRTGATPTVRVGEAIGKGTVKAITLEGVEYQRAGSVRSIAIDQSLAGSVTATAPAGDPSIDPAAPPSQQPTTRPGGAAPSAPPGNAKDTAIKDILERLRQRREQELRK